MTHPPCRPSTSSLALGLVLTILAGPFPGSAIAAEPKTSLVSATPSGDPGGADSAGAFISGNGRYVAFISLANDLIRNDDNHRQDVFVRDLKTDKTRLASLNSRGKQADAVSTAPSISADGRYVAFVSSATNLTPKREATKDSDIFVRDLRRGETVLVSVSTDGEVAEGANSKPMISADGGSVVFESFAKNLVDGDTNRSLDVFVRDLAEEKTERVNLNPNGEQADDSSGKASISADGRYVAFDTLASNFGEEPEQLFKAVLRDREEETTEVVSLDSAGLAIDGTAPTISGDGRFVAFESFNLEDSAFPNPPDILLRDRVGATTENVSVPGPGGSDDGSLAYNPDLSADGQFVVFTSGDELVPSLKCCFHVFRYDTETGLTTHIDTGNPLISGEGGNATISDDGKFVAFQTLTKPKGGGGVQLEVFVRGPIGSG